MRTKKLRWIWGMVPAVIKYKLFTLSISNNLAKSCLPKKIVRENQDICYFEYGYEVLVSGGRNLTNKVFLFAWAKLPAN